MSWSSGINSSISFGSSLYSKFFERIPNSTLKNPQRLTKLGRALASPHWNRVALGTAAICSQPFFDRYNKNVDEDTAITSMFRTFSKILVGTLVGFLVRGGCYKATEYSIKKHSNIFVPEAISAIKDVVEREQALELHKNTFSTLSALVAMLFTNVFLDAPLTTKLTNFLKNRRKIDEKLETKNERMVINA